MRGLSFWGVHLTPEPVYASRQQLFVEGVPFQFQVGMGRCPRLNIFMLKDTPYPVRHVDGDNVSHQGHPSFCHNNWFQV